MGTARITKWRLRQFNTDILIDINASDNCMVGRRGDAKVCLKSNKSSRNHATFVVNVEGNLLVQDLKSFNGTYVNGNQIAIYILHRVYPGDVIGFGIATIDDADDDRDRQSFFEVIEVAEPPEDVQGAIADSTTDIRDNASCSSFDFANPSRRNTTNEVRPDSMNMPSVCGEIGKDADIIEIGSSEPEYNPPSEIKVANIQTAKERSESSKPKRTGQKKKLIKDGKLSSVIPLSTSLNSLKNSIMTKDTTSSNISNRRHTIEAESIGNKASDQCKASSSKSSSHGKNASSKSKKTLDKVVTQKSITKVTADDFDELLMALDVPESGYSNPSNDRGSRMEGKEKDVETKSAAIEDQSSSSIPKPSESIHENEQLSRQEFNLDVQKAAEFSKIVDKTFTTNNDNSIIIDITDDNDDDMDFSSSQIFQMSQIVKTEARDDMYQKIKNELAEMDFCNEEIVLNTVPINIENDYDNSGFENTQAICAFLQDGIDSVGKNQVIKSKNEKMSSDCEVIISEGRKIVGKTLDSAVVSVLNKNNVVSNNDPLAKINCSVEKRKKTAPPIIEARSMSKPTRTSPRNSSSGKGGTNKDETTSNNKRKSSIESNIEKKKIRSNSKSCINLLPQNPKEIMLELKRRRSNTPKEIDKTEKSSIKEERRKKLKKLASPNNCKSVLNEADDKIHNSVEELTMPINKNDAHKGSDSEFKKPKTGTVDTDASSKSVQTGRNTGDKSKKVINENVGYDTLKPPLATYNLRRTKSSDEIKLHERNKNLHQNRPVSRHSINDSVKIQPSTSSNIPNPRLEFPSANRADPRKTQNPNMYTNHIVSNEASRRLMWTNGGPARKPITRRLANVDDITKKMVQWLPNWLLEQVDIDTSPPVNNPPATKIPLTFRDFNHYYSTFSKLVLLENWQYLFKGFREASEKPRKVKVEHVRVFNDLLTFDCVCYITRQELRQGIFYRPEDFLLLECVTNDRNNCYMSLNFGIVQNCRKSPITNESIISVKLGDSCPGDPHTKIEFSVLTRYQPDKEINIRKMPIVKVLTNIRGHLMLIRAIKGIEQSPLCSMILNPKMSDYKFITTHRDVIQPHDLNAQQKAIVLEAASLCTGNKHGIYCVKGPPGTGKSTVIVNLLFQIIFSYHFSNKAGKPPMILLAAPSNTAVDNLISKMVTLKQNLRPDLKHQIKCVRIGPESSISKEVIGYSLPKLAEKHVPLKNIDVPQIKAAKERNENLVEFSKTFFGDQYAHELKMCENLIIEKSNIICTTLNSCINGRLIDAVNRGLIEFTCCIIDEATQCHEAESLLPTILGIDKLVLVGDPQQLNATIMNRDALKLGFGQSLFSRLANNFRNDPRSPIKLLTDQYRMHPEICSFPNRYFYDGKLRSFAKPANKLPDEIRPYLVFNCEKVSYSTDYTNMDEVILIKKLLSTLLGMVDRSRKYSVGIITPYNAQKDLICNNMADIVAENTNCKITTNTVDSFQGSENDVVIISCVRGSSNSFLQNENRLNVALTRAKQALYIIGNYTLFKDCRTLYDLREDAKKRKVLLDIKQNPQSISNFSKYLLKKSNNNNNSK